MIFITENIAIGNSQDAKAPEDVTAILNVAFDLDVHGVGYPTYLRHKVGLIDGPGNALGLIVAAVLCLHSLLKTHRKVLVHCHSGRSRSATVVALYLACAKNIDVLEAYTFVKKAKTDVSPHEALVQNALSVQGICRASVRSLA